MKKLSNCIIGFSAIILLGCSSTRSVSSFESAYCRIRPGMTKQEVYTAFAAYGPPAQENGKWESWEINIDKYDMWFVDVTFDESGRVSTVQTANLDCKLGVMRKW